MKTISIKEKIKNFKTIKEDFANIFDIAYDGNYYFYNISVSLFLKDYNNLAPSYFKYYRVEEGDTWTNLSFSFYDTIELWWIICKVNNIVNPMDMPKEGDMLKILDKRIVKQILESIK